MFGLFKSSKPKLVHIDGIEPPIEVNSKETILTAALRQGVAFPHSCRVGGCAACKCQLTSGKVKELTESAYILSEDELDQGYVLACQSVPKTDVSIKVANLQDSPRLITPRTFSGTVASQQHLTHDIVALQIQLKEPMQYTAGQYALLSVPGLIPEGRSYSFATAPGQGQRNLTFYIRQVPGGELSGWAQGDVQGTGVQLVGPFGNFYLRDSEQPILCVAGGSGLAPVKALLEDALKSGVERPVVFLFGARTQQDLYCLDEIKQLQQHWPSDFQFVPVLSAEPEDSDWQGARGLVTELLPDYTSPIAQAYMCGPPAMLDAAEASLQQLGIPEDQIFSDKFLDKSSNLKTA